MNAQFHPVTARCVNALTIDVEDYFQVSRLAAHIPQAIAWDSLPCRVEANMDRILALLAEARTYGRPSSRSAGSRSVIPRLVRSVVDAGHELASHGYEHAAGQPAGIWTVPRRHSLGEGRAGGHIRRPRSQTDTAHPAFRLARRISRPTTVSPKPDTATARASSDPPRSLRRSERAAIRARGASPDCSRCRVATVRALRSNWPAGGGGYFRLLPYRSRAGPFNASTLIDRESAIFYFHPWELDPEQPRVTGPDAKARFRHYLNLKSHGSDGSAVCWPISAGIASTGYS